MPKSDRQTDKHICVARSSANTVEQKIFQIKSQQNFGMESNAHQNELYGHCFPLLSLLLFHCFSYFFYIIRSRKLLQNMDENNR